MPVGEFSNGVLGSSGWLGRLRVGVQPYQRLLAQLRGLHGKHVETTNLGIYGKWFGCVVVHC